jgi:hypothetical protein
MHQAFLLRAFEGIIPGEEIAHQHAAEFAQQLVQEGSISIRP